MKKSFLWASTALLLLTLSGCLWYPHRGGDYDHGPAGYGDGGGYNHGPSGYSGGGDNHPPEGSGPGNFNRP